PGHQCVYEAGLLQGTLGLLDAGRAGCVHTICRVHSGSSLAGDLPANAEALLSFGHCSTAIFQGNSSVTVDFGKNIAGIVSVHVGPQNEANAVGITFSESSLWVNSLGSDGTATSRLDAVLWLPIGDGKGTHTTSTSPVEIATVTVNFTATPKQELTAYTGYFNYDDELVNRIWYAGAYTNQLCTIDSSRGDSIVRPEDQRNSVMLPKTMPWWLNWTITNGSSAVIDRAKRDRIVWPADMVISNPCIMVSTFDLDSTKNSIESLLGWHKAGGQLPYNRYPFVYAGSVSFIYHLHTLVAVSDSYHYSGDLAFLTENWSKFVNALAWFLNQIDSTGLMNVTTTDDWLRVGMGGHRETGTRAFMAIGALLGEQHSYLHDLESFFWVLFWRCIHYSGPGQGRTIARFVNWNTMDMVELSPQLAQKHEYDQNNVWEFSSHRQTHSTRNNSHPDLMQWTELPLQNRLGSYHGLDKMITPTGPPEITVSPTW
ncbi:hypothetical protein JX266_014252, partial [Neoarthrinium moseri]